uniref:L1 transposable element RRM domain-containing protein n=1 Tax=Latimeria chalumnae TaxID=7897 RepID=H2ZSQ7_LATCH
PASPDHEATTSLLLQPINATGEVAMDVKNVLLMLNKLTVVITSSSETLTELKDLMSTLTHRVSAAEHRVSNIEDAHQNVEREVEDLKRMVSNLHSKLDDQENRARRNNVCFVGFPEGVEKGRPIKFLQELLPELLKLPSGLDLDIERTHQSLAPRSSDGQRPRPFITKFLRYPVHKQSLMVVRTLGSLEWQGNKILIFPDLTCKLIEQQRKFLPAKKLLREKGLKYGLFYLAMLKITINGETSSFMEPQAVEEFLQR